MSDDLYREQILDHYRNPRNISRLEQSDLHAEEDNPLCGDKVAVELALRDGRIVGVAVFGRGCAISQASASMLSERLDGLSLEEAGMLGQEEVLGDLGVDISPARMRCALLGLKTLRSALGLAGPLEGF